MLRCLLRLTRRIGDLLLALCRCLLRRLLQLIRRRLRLIRRRLGRLLRLVRRLAQLLRRLIRTPPSPPGLLALSRKLLSLARGRPALAARARCSIACACSEHSTRPAANPVQRLLPGRRRLLRRRLRLLRRSCNAGVAAADCAASAV